MPNGQMSHQSDAGEQQQQQQQKKTSVRCSFLTQMVCRYASHSFWH
jgi:hypothetical protein